MAASGAPRGGDTQREEGARGCSHVLLCERGSIVFAYHKLCIELHDSLVKVRQILYSAEVYTSSLHFL